jgi:hypothetical protein
MSLHFITNGVLFRWLSLSVSVAFSLALLWLLRTDAHVWYATLLLLGVSVLGTYGLLRGAAMPFSRAIALPIIIFDISALAQFFYLDNPVYQYGFIVGAFMMRVLYWSAVRAYRFYPERYPVATLSGLLGPVLSGSFFFALSALYGTRIFVSPSWTIIAALLVLLVIAHVWALSYWVQLTGRQLHTFRVAASVLLLQVSLGLMTWPTSVYVCAFVGVTIWFMMQRTLPMIIRGERVASGAFFRYGYGMLAVLFIVLLTARWT